MSKLSMSTSVLLFVLSLYGTTLTRANLPKLTDQMKVCSTVLYSDEAGMEQFKVDEFVDQREQSIRLDVLNVVSGHKDEASNKAIYFKLVGQHEATQLGQVTSDPDEAKRLVMFDLADGRCKERLTSEWKLKELTRLLSRLMEPEYKLSSDKDSPLSIGTFGLLKLICDNANMFVLDSKSYDELTLADNYHFSLKLNNFWGTEKRNMGRLIATMAIVRETYGEERSSLTIGTSRLSGVLNGPGHLSSIAIVVLRDDKLAALDEHNSLTLLEEIINNGMNGLVGGIIVAYNLFNECSLTKRLEHKEAVGEDIKDPFLMPAGSGCGKLMNNNHPYYMRPRQFSGQFKAKDFKREFYVAYDELSNHLRYDEVGDHKMIYALDSKLVTFVATDTSTEDIKKSKEHQGQQVKQSDISNRSGGGGGGSNKTVAKSRYLSHAHCAQTEIQSERILWWPDKTWSPLAGVNSVVDILGIGHNAGLMYLGKTTLKPSSDGGESSDPLICHVFERQIVLADLPLLVYMHVQVTPSDRNSLYLVYYFVDELDTLTRAAFKGDFDDGNGDENPLVPSMWLKRVEFLSFSEMSRFSFINAQITFNKFSWSLETVGEDTRNRQLQLAHPVRAFDLVECWPERSQFQLNLVLQQAQPGPQIDPRGHQLDLPPEDKLINDLARQIPFKRSQISDFSVLDFTQQLGNVKEQAIEGTSPAPVSSLLIQSKLTFPLQYDYKTQLIGWLESIEPLQLNKQVKMVETRLFTLIHECALKLATESANENRFHMLFCPKVGCGRLLVSVKELEESSEASKTSNPGATSNLKLLPNGTSPHSGPMIHVYNKMCELHVVKKQVHLLGMTSKADKVSMAKDELTKPNKLIGAYQITKVALESGSAHLAAAGRDQVIVFNTCYTDETRLLRDSEPVAKILGEQELRLLRLEHQSRVYCHKACLMYHYCETYSYNHANRECILANIQPDTLTQDMRITLEKTQISDNNACAIYSIDQIAVYRRTSEIMPQTPANFVNCAHKTTGVVLAGVELSKCASLCHTIDWSMRIGTDQRTAASGDAPLNSLWMLDDGCQQFSYMHLKSLCKFRVPDRAQVLSLFQLGPNAAAHSAGMTLIGSVEELEDYLAAAGPGGKRAAAHELEAMETYKRDMGQYYSMAPNSFIDVIQPLARHLNGTTRKADDNDGDGPTTAKITRERFFFDDCMRECTLGPCYAFDFCSQYSVRMHIGTCYLYSIRSPLSIEALAAIRMQPGYLGKWPKLKMQAQETTNPAKGGQAKPSASLHQNRLTSLEELFYHEGKSDRHEVLVKSNDRCEHHYLAGDYLHIKRSLVEASGGDSKYYPSTSSPPPSSPSSSSSSFSEQQGGELDQADERLASISVSYLIIQLAAGLIIGFVMFIIKPTVTDTVAGQLQKYRSSSSDGQPTLLARLRSRFASNPRERLVSEPRLEVHEMVDIDR